MRVCLFRFRMLEVVALGGLGEFGMNMMALSWEDTTILVDAGVMFPEPDPLNLITALQPDVLVKGGDWPIDQIIGREVVERRGGTVKTIPLVPGMSTTALIQRIRSHAH